jgi:hypothetical protein
MSDGAANAGRTANADAIKTVTELKYLIPMLCPPNNWLELM